MLAGIDVLRDEGFERLRGERVGLITNASGRARDGASTVDLLLERARREAHGAVHARARARRRARRERRRHAATSERACRSTACTATRSRPAPTASADIDTLVFDVQDVGTRFFTYAATMRQAMAAARDHDVRFIVLDRPNPIDGIDVAGPVLVPPSVFVRELSLAADPARDDDRRAGHACSTPTTTSASRSRSCTMRGWRREAYGDETGLPWVNPSPNLRSVDEAVLYPAIGLLEATNLSVGRGTDAPFERLGAPWIDGSALAAAVERGGARGRGLRAGGLHARRRPVRRARLATASTSPCAIARGSSPCRPASPSRACLRRLYRREWEFAKLDRLLVHPEAMSAIDAGLPLAAIVETYRAELAAFMTKREKYLLYGTGECAAGPR